MKIRNHHISFGLFTIQIFALFVHFLFVFYWAFLSLFGVLFAINGIRKTKRGEQGYAANVIGLILNGITLIIGFWFASKDWGMAFHP